MDLPVHACILITPVIPWHTVYGIMYKKVMLSVLFWNDGFCVFTACTEVVGFMLVLTTRAQLKLKLIKVSRPSSFYSVITRSRSCYIRSYVISFLWEKSLKVVEQEWWAGFDDWGQCEEWKSDKTLNIQILDIQRGNGQAQCKNQVNGMLTDVSWAENMLYKVKRIHRSK